MNLRCGALALFTASSAVACNLVAGIGDLPYPSDARANESGASDGSLTDDMTAASFDAGDATTEGHAEGSPGPSSDGPDEATSQSDAQDAPTNQDAQDAATTPDLAAAFFVQVGANSISGSGTPTLSVSADFPGSVRAHDTLVIAADFTTSAAPVLMDTVGNTFLPVVGPFGDGNGLWAAIWYVPDSLGGLDSVTATIASGTASDYLELYAHEYTGIVGKDGTAAATGTSSVINSGLLSTTRPNDVVFAFVATGTAVAANPYYPRSTFNSNLSEDTLAGLAGSHYAVAQLVGGGDWVIVAAAFQTQSGDP